MDPLFSQVDKGLTLLDTDESVSRLVELITSIQSPIISEHIIKKVLEICQSVHPHKALALLKFVFMYSKKDPKFFSLIKSHVSTLVMNCYNIAIDPETTRLYIQSWRMSAQWRDIIDPCLRRMQLVENREMLLHAVKSLEETEMRELISRLRKSPHDNGLMSEVDRALDLRLDSIISSINSISSVM